MFFQLLKIVEMIIRIIRIRTESTRKKISLVYEKIFYECMISKINFLNKFFKDFHFIWINYFMGNLNEIDSVRSRDKSKDSINVIVNNFV